MKQELLEYLIRTCIREVITQVNEVKEPKPKKKDSKSKESGDEVEEADSEFKGAATPPADGQGAGENVAVPKDNPEMPTEPSKPETPPSPVDLKGLVLVNPRDKSKLRPVPLKPNADDATIERDLYRVASTIGGKQPNVKVANATLRMAREAVKNPSVTIYLYLGRFDPESDEIFLLADKSLQVAKDASLSSDELHGPVVAPLEDPYGKVDPRLAGEKDIAQNLDVVAPGYVEPRGPSDDDSYGGGQDMTGIEKTWGGMGEQLNETIKKMVKQILSS